MQLRTDMQPVKLKTTDMQPVKLITDDNHLLKKFILEINEDLTELNNLIKLYNQEVERPKKIARLQAVYRRKQEIESKFSDGQLFAGSSFQSSAAYAEVMHEELFESLQNQFQALGISSMLDVATLDPTAKEFKPGPSHNMEEILANMTPQKTRELLTLLTPIKGDCVSFDKLYAEGSAGYTEYQGFLSKHKIAELDSYNSRNYLITPIDDSAPQVLKVNHHPTPKTVENFLRARSLKYVLTGNIAQRAVRGVVEGKDETRILLITEYCPGGSLDKHSQKQTDAGSRLQSSLNIFGQMARILLNIQNDGCAFLDMKRSNWLLDADNMLRMHDGKSLIRTYNGNVDPVKTFEEHYIVLTTDHVRPPESAMLGQFSADKAHAYMLGKNLYEYLTCLDVKKPANFNYYKNVHDAATLDFSSDVFIGKTGTALKALILDLVKPNPADRKSIKEALTELSRIQDLLPHTKCLRLINELQSQYPDAQSFCQNMRVYLSEAFTDKEVQDLIETIGHRSRSEEILKKINDLREGPRKGEASIEELYERIHKELTTYLLSEARHAELLQEIERLQGKENNQENHQQIQKLQQKVAALRAELETRYSQYDWKAQYHEKTGVKGLQKNVTYLTKQLLNYLEGDCRTFLQDLVRFDLDYAESIDKKLTSINNRVNALITIRDELAQKHTELHTKLSNECNQLNLEVNKDSESEYTAFDKKIKTCTISFLESIKNELAAAKRQKEQELASKPVIIPTTPEAVLSEGFKFEPVSLPKPTSYVRMPEPASGPAPTKRTLLPGFEFSPVPVSFNTLPAQEPTFNPAFAPFNFTEFLTNSRFAKKQEEPLIPEQAPEPVDVKKFMELLVDLEHAHNDISGLQQFTVTMREGLQNPQSPQQLLATGELITKKQEEVKNKIFDQCQQRINQLRQESSEAANLIQFDLNQAKTIAACKNVANTINITFEQISSSKAQEAACQRVLQECYSLLQQNRMADPQKQSYYMNMEQFLNPKLPLAKLEEKKGELTIQLAGALRRKAQQELEQKQLQQLKSRFEPFLVNIESHLPGGDEGKRYCTNIRTQLQTANFAKAKNALAAVEKYYAEKSKSTSEHINACQKLIKDIRETTPWKQRSTLCAREEKELNAKILPLYQLQEMKKSLTQQLECIQLQNECAALIGKMRREMSSKDKVLLQYLNDEQNTLKTLKSKQELTLMLKQLKQVNNDPATRIIKKIIDDYRYETGCWAFFSIGKTEKADKIEAALFNVPVLERANISNGKGAATAVRDELARKRYGLFAGQIDENSSEAFKTFKDEMEAEKKARNAVARR